MTHPNSGRRKTLILLAVANVIVMGVMQSLGQQLKPGNIVAFEFAGSLDIAARMVADWKAQGVTNTLFFLLGFDYLFMVTYCAFLWLSLDALARSSSGALSLICLRIGQFQPLAALADAMENLALFQVALETKNEAWPTVAWACAAFKFTLVGLGIAACLFGLFYAFFVKKRAF